MPAAPNRTFLISNVAADKMARRLAIRDAGLIGGGIMLLAFGMSFVANNPAAFRQSMLERIPKLLLLILGLGVLLYFRRAKGAPGMQFRFGDGALHHEFLPGTSGNVLQSKGGSDKHGRFFEQHLPYPEIERIEESAKSARVYGKSYNPVNGNGLITIPGEMEQFEEILATLRAVVPAAFKE